MKKQKDIFTDTQKTALAEAVRKAEEATAGEIVPYVARQSDAYAEAHLRAGSLFAFLVLVIFSLLRVFTNIWLPFSIVGVSAAAVLAYGAAVCGTHLFPRFKRLFIPPHAMRLRVDERATLAFLTEEVFATRNRTGILLFISLFERQVRVMGDKGINAKVGKQEWDEIVAILVRQMKARRPFEGLLEAIERSGSLLEKNQVERPDDDTNELDDAVRISDV